MTKNIAGLPATGLPVAMTFDGVVTCGEQTAQNWSVTVAQGASSGDSAALTFFDGDTCTVTENTPPAAPAGYEWTGTPLIEPATTAALGSTTPITVNVTNTLLQQTGSLTVTKQIGGVAAATSQVNGTFGFAINCGAGQVFNTTITVIGGASNSTTVDDIPAATACTVTETTLPDAPAGYEWQAAVYENNPATVTANGSQTVTVTNPLRAQTGTGVGNAPTPVPTMSGLALAALSVLLMLLFGWSQRKARGTGV